MRTGDFVQHAHSEHNQEADESAKESRKSRRTKEMNRKWKATVGWWDGSAKEDGRCRCGVVINGAETDGWVTISQSAVPKKMCSALAAENFWVNSLTEVVDLIARQDLTVRNIESCTVDCVGKSRCA